MLDTFEMFISVLIADRIKDEDQAVRSSNWNLLRPAISGGGRLALPLVSHDHDMVSLQACGGHVQTREVGDLKTGSEKQKPIRIHGTIAYLPTSMVDFYGKCR